MSDKERTPRTHYRGSPGRRVPLFDLSKTGEGQRLNQNLNLRRTDLKREVREMKYLEKVGKKVGRRHRK